MGTNIKDLAHRLRMLRQKANAVGTYKSVPEEQLTALCSRIDCPGLLIIL